MQSRWPSASRSASICCPSSLRRTRPRRRKSRAAQFHGEFRRDLKDSDFLHAARGAHLKDSDFLHWGEGKVSVSRSAIALAGKVAPGPDYKLYLSPEFVETEADFARLKPRMARVGDVRTFENFVVPVPATIDPAAYNTVIVWCESFSQFITAAKYR
jgi:hypothetical protein